MHVRTEAEERALVENLRADISGPSVPENHPERDRECLRALHNSIFEILDWNLEDQPDIDEAMDKVWLAACDAGWGPGEVGVAMGELESIYRSEAVRERIIASFSEDDDESDDEETSKDVSELENLENELADRRPLAKRRPWKSLEPAGDRFGDEVAATYLAERAHKPIWQAENRAVEKYLDPLPSGARIIDLPFRTGRFVQFYRANGWIASGIETSSAMLEVAREQIGADFDRMDIRQCDPFTLPYQDDYFDAAVCIRFVESIIPYGRVPEFLRELRRVTKGFAVIRLNNRLDGQEPVDPPKSDERMGSRLFISDLPGILRPLGWELSDSIVVQMDLDGRGEKRVWRLDAI